MANIFEIGPEDQKLVTKGGLPATNIIKGERGKRGKGGKE